MFTRRWLGAGNWDDESNVEPSNRPEGAEGPARGLFSEKSFGCPGGLGERLGRRRTVGTFPHHTEKLQLLPLVAGVVLRFSIYCSSETIPRITTLDLQREKPSPDSLHSLSSVK